MKKVLVAISILITAGTAHAGEYKNYLMNASPSRDMDAYLARDDVSAGFDVGPVMRGQNDAALVWLRGRTAPPVSPGITVLGNGYQEVFGDSGNKGVYNAACGRQTNDTPRPFNAFAGCEEEMGL